jgi:hypothetical protein
VSCPATPFSGERPPDPNTASFSNSWYHGDGIWVALAPPYVGRWYAGEPALKVLWYSEVAGELRITGRRLDPPGAVLSAEVPSGYEEVGYQPSSILIPEPGCWEITGSVGEQTLRVVADVLAPELHPLRAA